MSRRRRRRHQPRVPVFIYPAVIIGLGLAALVLAFVLPATAARGSTPEAAILLEASPGLDGNDQQVAARARRLTPADTVPSTTEPRSEPQAQVRLPVIKSAPPSEAQPAVQARGLSSSTGRTSSLPDAVARTSSSSSTGTSSTGPYTLVVVPEGPAEVDGVAADLVERLQGRGIQARVAALDDAGRPDALLVLGEAGSAASETWYCDPGPDLSARLAQKLVRAGSSSSQSGDGGPQTAFPCEEVHAGRARVPAVLLELPAAVLERRDAFSGTIDDMAGGISRFFSENAANVRGARNAAKLVWPAGGPITSYYGPSHPLGIDIAQPQGNITAAIAGTVVWAGGDPCCGYGRYVVIQSSDGIETLYAHLGNIAVRKGQKVRAGQSLGRVGCTGHCSGNHLHFEVYDKGRRQNPMLYLP